MALTQTGELLAVTTDHISPRAGGESFTIRKFVLFDKDQGRTVEVAMGREFPTADFNDMKRRSDADERPRLTLSVVVSAKGGLYCTAVLDAQLPAHAAKS